MPHTGKINTARFHGMRCLFGLITKDELHDELRKLDWRPDDDPAFRKGARAAPKTVVAPTSTLTYDAEKQGYRRRAR